MSVPERAVLPIKKEHLIMNKKIQPDSLAKGAHRMITTVCYGQMKNWNSREEAIRFFRKGIANSEGSEQERYTKIVMQLEAGKTCCTDEE